ncbi:MAG: MMPL family transporter [Cyclobacteriaceae bacterium]|nr:MMPL family transporter [Cyclobacteriaceae bacterium]
MWTKLAHNIIKYRLLLVIMLGLITVFMGYFAVDVEMRYDFAKTVPQSDPEMQYFEKFREMFGEDGNVVALGIKDSAIYQRNNFEQYLELSNKIKEIEGVRQVLSLPLVFLMEKDTEKKVFNKIDIFDKVPEDQASLDSLIRVALDQKFFSNQLVNSENGALILLISIEKEILNTSKRLNVTEDILSTGKIFEKSTGVDVHFAGLPFVRSVIAGRVSKELKVFLGLSILITGFILLLFFRSWDAVIFPMLIIGVVVVWVLGSIVLFGYKITLLTGLIPPLIVVIGIPNSVYLINKYHQEYERHGNKVRAVSRVVRKIGMVTLITNITTALGFVVLTSTDIVILREFGIIAGLNIMATFVVSIILIPGVFSWLPAPTVKQLRHLKLRPLDWALTLMDTLVHRHRIYVYVVSLIIVVFSAYGMYQIEAVSHVIDDIPKDSEIKRDIDFFERNFSGIMPLEIVVDTGKKRGVTNLKTLRLLNEFEEFLGAQEHISYPVSLVSFVKATRQAFYNNNPDRYDLPSNNRERGFLLRYLDNASDSVGLLSAFVDTSLQKMRISMQVADIGSKEMDKLVGEVVQPKIDSLFKDTGFEVKITGTTPLFIKGNKFLIKNLRFSLILAFIIISIIMGVLFANVRMIIISLIPNIIPLMLTAGLMGYLGIPLKPSTALIFSIAFGISVDDSIHFLAKYRQELFANDFFVPIAISKSLRETGASMMYTSIILFAGFVIFAGSNFGGTVALGILTSTTLMMAMVTNLILLPSLLMTFDDGKRRKDRHPLIEQYDSDTEFYFEHEDEEIDLNMLKVGKAEAERINKLQDSEK